jgi:hypothetical protein
MAAATEDPVVGGLVYEDAAERQADAAADRGDRAEQRDSRRHFVLGELVTDDPEGEREDAAAEPLEAAPGDHERERVGQAGDDRPNREQRERDREQPLLAEHVAEAAEDRRRDRRDEEIRRDHPGRH